MSEPVFMFDGQDPQMKQASEAARLSFRLFWRELYWERQRIIPALDMALIKLPFTDGPRTDGRPGFEQMWVGEVGYDGEMLTGELLNSPNWLISVKEGDTVEVPFSYLTDWMMTVEGAAYGGYTVNLMRSRMGELERREHDEAWGLDFGDPNDIRTEIARERKDEGNHSCEPIGSRAMTPQRHDSHRDHPMCISMLEEIEAQLQKDSSIAHSTDDQGWTLLHREALAGNFGVVQLLVRYGADIDARTPAGYLALDLARMIGWNEIANYLQQKGPAP